LEHAQQERKGLKVLSGAPIHENSTSKHPKYENEHEMIHLYHTINSLTQDSKNKVIQFIGSCKGEGTSTLIRDFVRVAASMLDEPVLLLDANRQSCHASFFGIRPDSGLAEVILKKKPLRGAVPDRQLEIIYGPNLFEWRIYNLYFWLVQN